MLSDLQKDIYNYIKFYVINKTFPPSIREIAKFLNISTWMARQNLIELEKFKWIIIYKNKSRGIKILK